ncbi:uncharacterized protein BYT42DRAFT_618268 [Radiomyces spectabilis]|uniref:uncharacterized protein n=1 Tax=Radiomyces spectabilis TaxID=64574 RepID=UPI00221EFC83|nr:uncharacterized protein BYT42DRAFT_618268 [Radiomyces spectabilis]KAI8366761.1 hypothetical protein BYT42DRAFT_618268 [Radiomyces spectabilis]
MLPSDAHLPQVQSFNLNDDCLEAVFKYCGGCPWILCQLSQVNRKWHEIARRPSVWRYLVLDKWSLYIYYKRLLVSPHWHQQILAVDTLVIRKSYETRHGHLSALPLQRIAKLSRLVTKNLCLYEILRILKQLGGCQRLRALDWTNIETWCHSQQFTFDLFNDFDQLQHLRIRFQKDGANGFAPFCARTSIPRTLPANLSDLCITCVRDLEHVEQRSILESLDSLYLRLNEIYNDDDMDDFRQRERDLIARWQDIEQALLIKYSYAASLPALQHFEIGFCYAWTAAVWRQVLLTMAQNTSIFHLGLYGWDQLMRLQGTALRCSEMEQIRIEAEQSIAECFLEMAPRLRYLELIDFSIGLGLLQTAHHLTALQHVHIRYSSSFKKNLRDSNDPYPITGPLIDFITILFCKNENASIREQRRNCSIIITVDGELQNNWENDSCFFPKSLLGTIRSAIDDTVVLKFNVI